MLSNSISILILIVSIALILIAVFNKRLRQKHNQQVDAIKSYEDSLNEEEKRKYKKSQDVSIIAIEIAFSLLIVIGYVLLKN